MDIGKLATIAIAFLSFSFAASATYIVNDLWDLDSDRAHPRKKERPFASARIPILNGLAVAGCLLILALLLAFVVSEAFFLILLLYVILTSAYSWVIKEYVLLVDGVPNPRHSGGASKVGIHYADADVSLFFLADAFLFYQHHSAR